jgi:hypothetical protein
MLSSAIAFVIGEFEEPVAALQQLTVNSFDHNRKPLVVPATIENDMEDVEDLRARMHAAVDRVVDTYIDWEKTTEAVGGKNPNVVTPKKG